MTRTRAWIALVLPPLAWFLFEQGLSALLDRNCALSAIGVVWGLASVAVCAVALRLTGRFRRNDSDQGDVWLARLTVLVATVFGLAILFQTLAVLIVPACLR